ncbi:MAG: ATP-binding protein, partial [Bacteroidota bacterium]
FFDKGIIAPVMNPVAYQRLSRLGKNEVKVSESIGDINYMAAYVPLMTPEKEVIAFLGLPYYSEQGKLRSEVMDFMGFIINAFAFLLLIAGAIAIYIANSITKPLDQVGMKLKQFQLGGKNELLTWKTADDEIGALIGEYNRLAQKLEESAELLAQSERDAAWREMAKQVAHEIKNPLTPMKLSIQYLRHAYQSNPTDIEPLLKRVSSTLIEQIDNLAQIATEFSSFAKMPRAQNSRFLINDLVNSVHELFSKGEKETELSLHLPEEEIFVFADKNQLMRVLNNLIKNAVQAIPDDRPGKVAVKLFKEADTAVIQVSDNGSGIPKEMMDKVFVPNFTTKSSGTGIGLAISKNIIESVNGQIYFKTVLDQGTDFFVKLPVEKVEELENA